MEPTLKQKLLQEMLEDSMTKSEVLAIAEKLAEHVKKIEEKTKEDVRVIHKTLSEVVEGLKKETNDETSSLGQGLKTLVSNELKRITDEHNSKMAELTKKMSEIKNGKDADENKIVEAVRELIKIPTIEELKDDLPIMGEEVRDSLELLKGDERLSISAIKGLRTILNSLKSKPATMGGGFSVPAMNLSFADPYAPTGDINGVNTEFVLSHTPSPATSLKVYRNGQLLSLTEDYTLSGMTVTLLVAPDTGEIIKVEHRI